MSTKLIPSQEEGKSVDLVETIEAQTVSAAEQLFQNAVSLLCRPSLWHETAGALSASFSIEGKEKEKPVEQGDYIRIKIPGPGLSEGDGDDWVKVESVKTNFDKQFDESFGLVVFVCTNPNTEGDAIAHFLADGASSSFIITRKDLTVSAYYKGRNEKPNKEDLALKDKVRNMIVAAGALAGISELQWTALLKGLLNIKS